MKRCFIFAAGTYYGLRERPQTGDLVLAADAGYLACRQAGITPDLLLGDFDSMDQPADFDHVRRGPVEKDDTDTMLAVKTGLEQGCGEFYIYGGTGGRRLDHTLANLQTLLYLRRHGARGYLYDNDFVWTAVENETITVEQTVEWGLLSVFCLGAPASGIDEKGVQYPLPRLPLGGVPPGRQQPHHRAQGPDHRPEGRPDRGVGAAVWWRCFRDKIACRTKFSCGGKKVIV